MLQRWSTETLQRTEYRNLMLRFAQAASGFWRQRFAWREWALTVLLVSIIAAQLSMQYLLSYWNRDFFDALEQKDGAQLFRQTFELLLLATVSTVIAIGSVWGRMTMQRHWRLYLSRHLIKRWLYRGRYRRLGQMDVPDSPQNPEYRIAEDVRIATDAPVDLSLSLLSSVVTVFVFFGILANAGGEIDVRIADVQITIPAYLGIGVVIYAGAITAAMLYAGRQWTVVVQQQLQAEATFRAAANLLRESGEGVLVGGSEREQRHALWVGLHQVIDRWRVLCGQHMRTTLVSHGNSLLAPIVGLLLCVPKYADGSMSLGEVTQAAAAFATVQGALNWLVDNFQRMSDWRSSALRVAALLVALDDLRTAEQLPPAE
jgi:vitamin B12/bleomycin/antimicrobial peptide transport system ATP-binding/permease protein